MKAVLPPAATGAAAPCRRCPGLLFVGAPCPGDVLPFSRGDLLDASTRPVLPWPCRHSGRRGPPPGRRAPMGTCPFGRARVCALHAAWPATHSSTTRTVLDSLELIPGERAARLPPGRHSLLRSCLMRACRARRARPICTMYEEREALAHTHLLTGTRTCCSTAGPMLWAFDDARMACILCILCCL